MNHIKKFAFLFLFLNFLIINPKSVSAANCAFEFSSTPSALTISPGGEVTYKYNIKNIGVGSCTGVNISIYYGQNEKYLKSDVAPKSANYYWLINKLGKGEQFNFSVTMQNIWDGKTQMYGEACASANGAGDACVKEAVNIQTVAPVLPEATTTPPIIPLPDPIPLDTSVGTQIQSWVYSGLPSCNSVNEYSDGRKIDVLKPEYYVLQTDGNLKQKTTALYGCNGYSESNVADIKTHSTSQFVTVSGNYVNMRTLLSKIDVQNTVIKTLTDFALSSGFTGVEIDFEGFGKWTATDYANYKKFITALQTSLHANGKLLIVDAPAIADTTYQGYFKFKYEDFADVDYVTIMAYDYQFDYGVGEPVAPDFWLKNIINWAKTKLPIEKIIIGMSSYGYHGTLGSYNPVIDTYEQSTLYPGFTTRTLNADGEATWTSNGTYYAVQEVSTLIKKKALIESMGIKNISVWHLGGNNWF